MAEKTSIDESIMRKPFKTSVLTDLMESGQGRDWSAISGRGSGRSPIKAADDNGSYRSYNNPMNVTFDPVKRAKTLIERGLDFADAAQVFEGDTLEIEDDRRDYGEIRIVCFGRLAGRLVVVGYTPRGTDRHIFSMRKANEREQECIGPRLGL